VNIVYVLKCEFCDWCGIGALVRTEYIKDSVGIAPMEDMIVWK